MFNVKSIYAGQWANEARGKYLSKYYFAFGIDQMAHQLCYLVIAYLVGLNQGV